MISFKDRSFCSSRCANQTCPRFFTDELHEAASKWWGGDDAPVAFMDFKAGGCKEWKEVK